LSKNAASVRNAQAGEGFMHRIVLVSENPKSPQIWGLLHNPVRGILRTEWKA